MKIQVWEKPPAESHVFLSGFNIIAFLFIPSVFDWRAEREGDGFWSNN